MPLVTRLSFLSTSGARCFTYHTVIMLQSRRWSRGGHELPGHIFMTLTAFVQLRWL